MKKMEVIVLTYDTKRPNKQYISGIMMITVIFGCWCTSLRHFFWNNIHDFNQPRCNGWISQPQPETAVANTPYGSYVTTTYVSYANIAPAGGVLAFVSFIFIIAFVLMFMYSSGLIYVGANKVKYGAVEGITCT